jgi:hypothetical protein
MIREISEREIKIFTHYAAAFPLAEKFDVWGEVILLNDLEFFRGGFAVIERTEIDPGSCGGESAAGRLSTYYLCMC